MVKELLPDDGQICWITSQPIKRCTHDYFDFPVRNVSQEFPESRSVETTARMAAVVMGRDRRAAKREHLIVLGDHRREQSRPAEVLRLEPRR